MKKLFSLMLVLSLALCPVSFAASDTETSSQPNRLILPTSTVANLTACAAANQGEIAVVTDANAATDCTTGGASTVNTCVCDGTNYVDVA